MARFFFIALLTSCALAFSESCRVIKSTGPVTWHLVYQNDSLGRPIAGSKHRLIEAVKRGSPVRVAWGEKLDDQTSDVEFSTPEFVTLVNDSDLVVQFPASMIQTDYMTAKKSMLKTDPPMQWRALMSTDGHYHQFHTELNATDVKRVMWLKTAMAWYVLAPENDKRPVPDLALKNGIQLDSIKKIEITDSRRLPYPY
jgi:hypothetical protein